MESYQVLRKSEQQAYWSHITGYTSIVVAVNTPESAVLRRKPMYKTAIDQLQYAKGTYLLREIFLDIIDVFESAVQEVVISQSDLQSAEVAIKLIHY